MSHWIILPILLPMLSGIGLLLGERYGEIFIRTLNVFATMTLLALAVMLLILASKGDYQVYSLGNWPAPFGILLVLDRLSALMLTLTALIALFSLLYALGGIDAQGSHFHALFQFQLAGLNGAFLTGDLFNLFVFFEILLLASYGLLLHGGGKARVGAAFHYVVLNLAGSTLFLFAIGILYGVTGTLNMADLALKIAYAPLHQAALLQAGALLLLVVFSLKAALLPLYFWLPSAYANVSAPVAALFAIMTKVGVYAIMRVFTLGFGPEAGVAANVALPWLLPLALATLIAGTLGVLASQDLRRLIAYFVITSLGTLLIAVGLFSAQAFSAALVYLMHTTVVTASMFLLADLISMQRGNTVDREAPPVSQPLLLGGLFFTAAIALTGMPPLSGFLGKLMILKAAQGTAAMIWIWSIMIITSLLGIVALSRIGSTLFWKTREESSIGPPIPATASISVIALLACSPLLVLLGKPVTQFADATAGQLIQPDRYMEQILGKDYIEAFRLSKAPSTTEAYR